jgi:hypothetical protein
MSDNRQRRYIAHLTERATPIEGMGIFTTWGYLTECGKWVETDTTDLHNQCRKVVRHQADDFWCETSTQAMAAKADKVQAIGERLVRQAAELRRAAQQETRERPALAEAADSSQPHGSPIGSGE